jgi:hypothetical protein
MKTLRTWKTIPRGSKIHLSVGQMFKAFPPKNEQFIPSSDYYITGFWANVCGLGKKSAHEENDFMILSSALPAFDNIY